MDYSYVFPAVKGTQAKRDYYIAMVPLKMIARLFPSDDEYVAPEFRAQRRVNHNRIPEISNYILNNRDTYVFSALAASIDGVFSFESEENSSIGNLVVSMDSKFLINDGQHRKAALLEALENDPSLLDETIPIVFFSDAGLARSQQMFTDLNKHAVKTSNSISELYDYRDQIAVASRNVVSSIPFLDKYVDKEKDILGKYSSSLFTLNNIYNSNKRILGKKTCSVYDEQFLINYWKKVTAHLLPWIDLENRELTKVELREKYIVTQAVVLKALGRLGSYYYENDKPFDSLKKLEGVDWRRSSSNWTLRTINENGKMITNERAVVLTTNKIKQLLDIELDAEELEYEKDFIKLHS